MTKSDLEAWFSHQVRAIGLPKPESQYRFAAIHVGEGRGVRTRLAAVGLKDWRFDFAWPERKIAAEIMGGIWIEGAHTRGGGYENDAAKINAAQLLGWDVYIITESMLSSGDGIAVIERALNAAI